MQTNPIMGNNKNVDFDKRIFFACVDYFITIAPHTHVQLIKK